MATTHLKVKIKSLVAETVIIRHEEEKLRQRVGKRIERTYKVVSENPEKRDEYETRMDENNTKDSLLRRSLFDHRKGFQWEMRFSLLAYGFLRSTPYAKIESRVKEENTLKTDDWTKVENMILRFGDEKDKRIVAQKLAAWKDAGTKIITHEERWGQRNRRVAAYQQRKASGAHQRLAGGHNKR